MGTNERQLSDNRSPERTCILTRDAGAKDALVRLALGPDGQVLPDVRAKAPGRGAYVGVTRAQLDEAQAKGKLKGALARAFKTGQLDIPADLGARIEEALRRNFLDRLGLEARGGMLISGSEKVDVACRKGEAMLLLHASDASADGVSKLGQGWRMGGGEELGMAGGLVLPFDRTTLSSALGRGNAVHLALVDAGAARRVSHALARYQAFLGNDARVNGGEPAGTEPVSEDLRNEGTE
ncbi:DUF448 domain-containing protein [Sphingomicrobium aestuariivivum]|uniref:DUF448 domain-containing protein n=1 Tax=Sphingomicrobium aestuariivivum TaxID=1582356 RepID=UPI001FD6511D|nr:DUF448 domain-containing protein [Sphingomicrobium aestuariivivum]MCJ8191674.1 DUF448 domain-containing protein [Sphingomicrobium aestuariivivum]